jgi:plasmid stabilization system protein ParE
MKRLVFAPAAEDDLIEIGAYIASDNPARALSFIDELEAKARQIAEHPWRFRHATTWRRACGALSTDATCSSLGIRRLRCGSSEFFTAPETCRAF